MSRHLLSPPFLSSARGADGYRWGCQQLAVCSFSRMPLKGVPPSHIFLSLPFFLLMNIFFNIPFYLSPLPQTFSLTKIYLLVLLLSLLSSILMIGFYTTCLIILVAVMFVSAVYSCFGVSTYVFPGICLCSEASSYYDVDVYTTRQWATALPIYPVPI